MRKLHLRTGKIISNKKIANHTFYLKFSSPGWAKQKCSPSQFILIDTSPARFLLKPFSITESKNNCVGIIYRIIGEGTKLLSQKKVGQKIKFIGPLGNKKRFIEIEKKLLKSKRKIIFVAGGSGIASIIFLSTHFKKLGFDIKVFYGESDKSFVIDLLKFGIKDVVYCTDNGSYGEKGFVTEVFEKYITKEVGCSLTSYLSPLPVFVCGPKLMLKSLQKIVSRQAVVGSSKIKCYALLEEYMCCGIGLCRGCVVKVSKQQYIYQTVCKDGPLFDIKEIIF